MHTNVASVEILMDTASLKKRYKFVKVHYNIDDFLL